MCYDIRVVSNKRGKQMHFKRVINKTTDKTTYYIDNKRTGIDNFHEKQDLCRIKGMSYNSSLTTSDNKYIRHSFYMN